MNLTKRFENDWMLTAEQALQLAKQSKTHLWEHLLNKPILMYRGISGIVSNSLSLGHQRSPLSGVVKGMVHAWVLFKPPSPFIILFCIVSRLQCPRTLCIPSEQSILVMRWISELWQFSLSLLQLLRVHTFKVSSLAVFLQWIQLLFLICSHRADCYRAGI